jgi:hypothetical protein
MIWALNVGKLLINRLIGKTVMTCGRRQTIAAVGQNFRFKVNLLMRRVSPE